MKKLIISAILFFSLIFAQPAMALTEQEVLAIRGQINILLQIIVELQKQLAQLIEQQKQLVQTTNQLLPPVSGATEAIGSPVPITIEPDIDIALSVVKDNEGWVVSIKNTKRNSQEIYVQDIAMISKIDGSTIQRYEDVLVAGLRFYPWKDFNKLPKNTRYNKYRDVVMIMPDETLRIKISDPKHDKYSGLRHIDEGFFCGGDVLFPDLYFEK